MWYPDRDTLAANLITPNDLIFSIRNGGSHTRNFHEVKNGYHRTHRSDDHIIDLVHRRFKGGYGNQRITMDDRGFREMLEAEGLPETSTERAMRVLRNFVGMLNEMPEELTSGHNGMGSSSDCYNIIPNDAHPVSARIL